MIHRIHTKSKRNFHVEFTTISDPSKQKWVNHKGVQKLGEVLNLKETCGYITFIRTGARDIGCENYDINVHLVKSKRLLNVKDQRNSMQKQNPVQPTNVNYIVSSIERLFMVAPILRSQIFEITVCLYFFFDGIDSISQIQQ